MKTRALILLALLCVLPVFAHAGNVTVTWTQDTATCVDGSPAATTCPLSGFEVSEGGTPSVLQVKETLAATARAVTYQNIAPGQQRCYALKALTGTGASAVKSDASPTSCVTIPFLPPKAPAGITVTVNVTITTP